MTTTLTAAATPDRHAPPTTASERPLPCWQRGVLLALIPELALGLLLFGAARQQLRLRLADQDRERGDVIQWVMLIAIGATITFTVGAIVYNKIKDKANSITTDTPSTGP